MKVDRLISMKIKGPEKVTVPKGEMWKLTPYGELHLINNESGIKKTEFTAVENDIISINGGSNSNNASFTIQLSGLAFTI